MKTAFLSLLSLASLASLLPADQFALDFRTGTSGLFTQKLFTTSASKLLGTASTGDPTVITLGTGLSFSGTTLNATASSGAWADITGKPSTFPPEAHNQAWSTITSTPTTLAGYGIADAITAATVASTYQPIIADGSLPLSKLATTGTMTAENYFTTNDTNPTRVTQLTEAGLSWYDINGSGFGVTLRPTIGVSPTESRIVAFNPNGNLITTADTATVTNTMLAGSIALSKLAITGTPDGTKFIRDDGSYQAVNLSGYLPLTGGTLTGPLGITGGTVTSSTPMLTQSQTWNASGVTFRGLEIAHTVTGAAAASTHLRILGGSSGATERLSLTEEKMTINMAGSLGRVLDLNSIYGTSTFSVGGGGALTVNGCMSLTTTGELRGTAVGNGALFCGIGYDTGSALGYIKPSTSTLQIGTGAASPIAYLVRGASARAGTDSNASGAALGIAGGNSTGTGNGGDFYSATYMPGSSGSTANAIQTRSHTIARFVNLTEATATNVASIALPSGKVVGGTATITVWASDGTDHQSLTKNVTFDAVNKDGTLTTTAASGLSLGAASAGTLSFTFNTSSSGNNLLLRVNATSDLTQTVLRCRLVITALNGDDVQTVTPQ